MFVRTLLASTIAFVALAAPAFGAVEAKPFEDNAGETLLVGHLAWDDAATGKRPGVLVVHEWWGHNDHARKQAERLAEAGCVGMALDMYGKGEIAILNGAADPMLPADSVAAYVKSLATAHADLLFANLPGAKHATTTPNADKAGIEGLGDNAAADENSWKAFVAQLRLAFP